MSASKTSHRMHGSDKAGISISAASPTGEDENAAFPWHDTLDTSGCFLDGWAWWLGMALCCHLSTNAR